VAHSASIGRHFYCTSSIQRSVFEIIHSLVCRGIITNDYQDQTRVILRRMMTSWIDWHMREDGKGHNFILFPVLISVAGRERPAHVVDIKTMEGLLDFISVGCLLELSPALDDRHRYGYLLTPQEQDKIEAASTRFRLFVRWYGDRYCLLAGTEWINSTYLFWRRLVDFSATVYHYLLEHLRATNIAQLGFQGPNPVVFLKIIISHFSESWPELVSPFQEAMKDPSVKLYYDGPEFTLMWLTDEIMLELTSLGFTENSDFPLTIQAVPPAPPRTPLPKRNRPSPESTPKKSPSTTRP
jgi:hypothetical protein